MDHSRKTYILLICRLFIGFLFVFASLHKIMDPAEFAVSVRNYMIVPPSWSNVIALTLPWVELLAGALLIIGVQTKPAALLTTVMLAVFLCAVIYAYAIGLDIDCGCFSSSSSSEGRVGVYHIVRDAVLVIISGAVLFLDLGKTSVVNLILSRHGYRSEPA